MSSMHPRVRSIIAVAVVGGSALMVLLLLWLTQVITMPVFLAGVVGVAALEGLAFLAVVRRSQRPETRPGAARGTGGATEVDTTGPYDGLGYDPMDGLPGTGRRPAEDG